MADWREFAKQEALRQGVDPSLVLPLVGQESNWNPNAVSPKGAAGFMQLMPGTAKQLGLSAADRFNPQLAIPAGITYLKQQLDKYQDPAKALAAYNAGPGAVDKFGGVPPYPETQNYVRKIAMAQKGTLSVDEADALLGGSSTRAAPRTLSIDEADALLSAKPTKAPLKVIDNTLPPANPLADVNSLRLPLIGNVKVAPWLARGMVGAGKGATEFLDSIGLKDALGLSSLPPARAVKPTLSSLTTGQAPQVSPQQQAANALESDPAAMIGNVLAQIGIQYAGGKLIGGAGGLVNSGANASRAFAGANIGRGTQLASDIGSALEATGTALSTPQTVRQALAAGSAFGALAQPGDPGERVSNALAGGIGGAGGYGIGKLIGVAGQQANKLLNRPAAQQATQDLTNELTVQLRANGLDFAAMPRAAQQSLLSAAQDAVSKTGSLDPDMLKRMADFQNVGIDPLKGWVTRNPQQWWQADTLNTVDPRISQRYQAANRALVQQAGQRAPEASDYQLGQRFGQGVQGVYDAKKAAADAAYKQARATAGRDIELDPYRFVNDVSNELHDQWTGQALKDEVLPWFQNITSGKEPFDMGTALQRLQALNGKMNRTRDPEQLFQFGIVKKHLINAIEGYGGQGNGPMPLVGADEQQQLALAFKNARGAASQYLQFEKNPVIQDVLGGKFTPEKLPDMMGKLRVDDLQTLAQLDQANPGLNALPRLRDAAAAYIRDAAVLQQETGGKFTVAGLRKALDRIGPENGKLLFGDDWNQYQSLLRAGGSIMNPPVRPTGSTTAPNLMRWLNMTKIPGVPAALELGATAAGKVKQTLDVNKLLQPGLYDPAQVLTNRQLIQRAFQNAPASPLPMVTAPGLLDYLNQ
jgi:hypothetical protein